MFAVRLSSTCLVHVATIHELDLVYPGPLWACLRSDMVLLLLGMHIIYVCMVGVFPIFPEGELEFVYIREAPSGMP